MDKKILSSLVVIAIVSALVGAGTVAMFSDIERSTGNVFQAGTIDLDPVASPIVKLEGLKPCEWGYATVDLHVSENDADGWFHITNVVDDGGAFPEPEKEVDPGNTINDISNHITFDLKIDGRVIIDPKDEMKLRDLECVWIYLGTLEASKIYHLNMSFHLQDVGNEYQGDKCTFDLEFLANQLGSPPPKSTKILLENKDPTTWLPIIGDGKWGIVEYETSTLTLKVKAVGLKTNTPHQLTLNSQPAPDSNDAFESMCSAIATGLYQHDPAGTRPPGFDPWLRGYWRSGVSTVLENNFWEGAAPYSEGIYNIHDKSNPSKPPEWYGLYYSDANGKLEKTVSATLPSGNYEWIKFIIKEVGGVDPSHPYGQTFTGVLMECWVPLFFTIP